MKLEAEDRKVRITQSQSEAKKVHDHIDTMQSKIDFSFLGAGLAVSLLILCLFGLGMMIFGATPSLYYGYCVAGTLIFALYIIFGM